MKNSKIFLHIFGVIILFILAFSFYWFQLKPESVSEISMEQQEMECLHLGSDYARKKCESLIKKHYIYMNRDGTIHKGIEGDGYQDETLSKGVSHVTYVNCEHGEPTSNVDAALCGKTIIDAPYFSGDSIYATKLSERLSSGNGFFIRQEEYENLIQNGILQ